MPLPFRDRRHAGRVLASVLEGRSLPDDALVLGLPRGGVPVAYEVARALGLPLDVFVVRKLGLPEQPELAVGAIASGGVVVLNEDVIRQAGLEASTVRALVTREREELARRERLHRGDAPAPALRGRTLLLVDDGLATGASMLAAVRAAQGAGAGRLVVAVPVAAVESCELLADTGLEVVCAETPVPFRAVGLWYEEFGQTTDAEVADLLAAARTAPRRDWPAEPAPGP